MYQVNRSTQVYFKYYCFEILLVKGISLSYQLLSLKFFFYLKVLIVYNYTSQLVYRSVILKLLNLQIKGHYVKKSDLKPFTFNYLFYMHNKNIGTLGIGGIENLKLLFQLIITLSDTSKYCNLKFQINTYKILAIRFKRAIILFDFDWVIHSHKLYSFK